jgi:hypothetical protein
VHDEFSYLLSCDTFVHGRLTNPGLEDSNAFDSFHILVQPKYVSKYPPGQGLFLAIGKFICGSPIFGVWISISLACAAICWMLQQWMPARWAFIGGMLAVIQLVFFGRPFEMGLPVGYWSQGFFGGAVAALGGALVYGAIRVLANRLSFRGTAILAAGAALLFLSRPFEGGLAALPAFGVFAVLIYRAGKSSLSKLTPLIVIGSLTVFFQTKINLETTGDAFRLPYRMYESKFFVPVFLTQPLEKKTLFSNLQQRQLYEENMQSYAEQQNLSGFTRVLLTRKIPQFIDFFFGPALSCFFVALPFVFRNHWMKLAGIAVAMELCGLATETWFLPHYAAPITGLLFLLLLQSMRRFVHWRIGERSVGRLLALFISCVFVLLTWNALLNQRRTDPGSWYNARAAIIRDLEARGGKHLIFVRYGPEHFFHHEWVYNGADLANSNILWAHEGSAEQNKQVVDHYPNRTLWLLYDDSPADVLRRKKPSLTRISDPGK